MSRDLIERLRNIAEAKAASNRDVGRRGKQWAREAEIEWQAADRIAALEAEASEGEGLRAALVEAREALDQSYNVTTYPGDGTSKQDAAIRAIDAALIPAPAREGNPEDDPRYPALLADAKARARNENLDGSPRRHAVASPPPDGEEQ